MLMNNTMTHKLSNLLTTFLEQWFSKWVREPAGSVSPGTGPGPWFPNALGFLGEHVKTLVAGTHPQSFRLSSSGGAQECASLTSCLVVPMLLAQEPRLGATGLEPECHASSEHGGSEDISRSGRLWPTSPEPRVLGV